MMTLTNLKSPSSSKNRKRRGRGPGTGQGTQGGRGHKGQKARKSGRVRTGFEGGAMPLYMRLPKKGFTNAPFRRPFVIVSLDKIEKAYSEGEQVDRESLVQKKLLSFRKSQAPLKILSGTLTKKLVFKGLDRFSKAGREMIEKVQGEIHT